MQAPSYLELADSSLVAIRAVAAAIAGQHCDPFERNLFERIIGRWVNRLSTPTRKAVLQAFTTTMGVSPARAPKVDIDEILHWALALYEEDAIFDGVVVGAPNGAVAHLASLMRFPFLTQHYLLAFKGRYAPDDSRAYFDDGVSIAREVLSRNPGLEAIVHYDPLHDRFLIKRVSFIRVKLKGFPEAYGEFIRKRVKPGGTVVSVRCTYPWLMYPVKADSQDLFYQVGGLGDVEPGEYLQDSDRLSEYRRRERGNPTSGWGIPDIEPVEYPESEWGSVGTLHDELKEFCDANGYRHIEITFPHPEGFSLLAFKAYKSAIKLAQGRMTTAFFDCFTHIDPRVNLITHAVPVWLPFICRDSYRFAKKMAGRIRRRCDIWLSLHPSFCDPVDLAPIDEWVKLFDGYNSFQLIGVDRDRYPADLSTYIDFARAAKKIAEENKRPYALAIDSDMLEKLAMEADV